MAPLATAEELETWMGVSFSAAEAVRADSMLAAASGLVRKVAGDQTITRVVDDTQKLRGTYDPVLRLPQRPVESVSDVLVDGRQVTGWELQANRLYRTTAVESGRLTHDHPWGGPLVVVTVTYTHGYADGHEALEAVKGVVKASAARAMDNPAGGMSSEAIDDWQGSYVEGSGGVWLTEPERDFLRFQLP